MQPDEYDVFRLRAAASAARTRAELERCAALLPRDLTGAPESLTLLAALYIQLWPFLAPPALPPWREAALSPAVQVSWLRAEILTTPEALPAIEAGELLYQALKGLTPEQIPAIEALLPALAAHPDPALHEVALDLLRQGLRALTLAPDPARAALRALLGSPAPGVVAGALEELAQPWARLAPAPVGPLLRLCRAAHPRVAAAAIRCAARAGLMEPLLAQLEDEGAPGAVRQEALTCLGEVATAEAIPAMIEIAGRDPLLFGRPLMSCLRALHRRGHFLEAAQAPGFLRVFLENHEMDPGEAAALAYTCRRALLDAALAAPSEDPSWERRLALIVAMHEHGPGDLPLADVILARLRDLSAAGAEPRCAAPFLRAVGAIGAEAGEQVVLEYLDRAPGAALQALRAIGGPRTAAALRERLGIGAARPVIAAPLRASRDDALALLWHLAEDAAARREILAHLDPARLPAAILRDLGAAPAEDELTALARASKDRSTADHLMALAAAGDARALPAITDLLLRLVSELDAGEALNPEARGEEARSIPAEITEAIQALGRRLHRRGKIRPACLLAAQGEAQAGAALLADLLLGLLRRPDLAPGEISILLRALEPVAGPRAAARLHRLMRHRDPHVRKAAIAALARAGAEAVSINLALATGAGDVQTARQSLLALAGVKATWAAGTIAGCLDHPNMNVKKTAAEALSEAGGPEAVPKLLQWLGRHDNPGLRGSLTGALRTILGPAFGATVLAAAEADADERARDLLLAALSGLVTPLAARSAARQGARIAPRLLELIALGKLSLTGGGVADLAAELEAHGLEGRGATWRPGPPAAWDADARALIASGWDEAVARRLLEAARREPLGPGVVVSLRRFLPEWLRLAASAPDLRPDALSLVLRLREAGLSAAELDVVAGQLAPLLAALREAEGELRDGVVALLEDLAPRLGPAAALALAAEVRAVPARPGAGQRPLLPLLRRLGAMLTRADLDRALAEAQRAADPWQLIPRLLAEAFQLAGATPRDAVDDGMRRLLEEAALDPRAVQELRASLRRPSRALLRGLIEVFPQAAAAAQPALLSWMEALQPLGAPPWILAEEAADRAARDEQIRVPHPADLDQLRSAPLRARYEAMLRGASREARREAARVLLAWPEEVARGEVLRAWLLREVDLPPSPTLAAALARRPADELAQLAADDRGGLGIARLAASLDRDDLIHLVPLLLAIWERGGEARAPAQAALRRAPADEVLSHIAGRLADGAWGYLDVLGGAALAAPELEALLARARAEGRLDVERALRLDPGPLRPPSAAEADAAQLAALRARRPPAAPPSREALLAAARGGDPEAARQALTALAARPEPEITALLLERMRDARPRVRLHAHRLLKGAADRETYLAATLGLLEDPLPDVRRSAIRILAFAKHAPALPAMVELLHHPHAAVRRAAAEGLAHVGEAALGPLRAALSRARPDRRRAFEDVIARIEAEPLV